MRLALSIMIVSELDGLYKPHCCELHIIRESCAKEQKVTTSK